MFIIQIASSDRLRLIRKDGRRQRKATKPETSAEPVFGSGDSGGSQAPLESGSRCSCAAGRMSDFKFINDGHKCAVNKRICLSAQYIGDEPISVGYYYFGEDGRMVLN